MEIGLFLLNLTRKKKTSRGNTECMLYIRRKKKLCYFNFIHLFFTLLRKLIQQIECEKQHAAPSEPISPAFSHRILSGFMFDVAAAGV